MPYSLTLIRAALRQRCSPEQNWALSRWQRWYFTAKLIVAVLICKDESEPEDWWEGSINVANIDFYRTTSFEFGAGADWTAVHVHKTGFGYFTNGDGYP